MAVSIGSGLGGFAAVAQNTTYGGTYQTPTRTLSLKSATATWNPHLVYGGPYLEGGQTVYRGAGRVPTYLDATGTIMVDVTNSGYALLMATSFASTATMQQLGTTTAYELGGASGVSLGVADTNGAYIDMQMGVPTTDGTQQPYSYHSCVITKAEWVFDRVGLVTASHDFDAQYVETSTSLITPSFPTSAVAFSLTNTSSVFKVGTLGSEAVVDGVKKCTITLERKMATDRIYLGQVHKESPVTNDYITLTAALDVDFSPGGKTALYDLFLANTPVSLIATAVGNQIGTSGHFDTFGLQLTNAFLDSGAEAALSGPDLVNNTLTFTGTLDASADAALKGTLISADTTF